MTGKTEKKEVSEMILAALAFWLIVATALFLELTVNSSRPGARRDELDQQAALIGLPDRDDVE